MDVVFSVGLSITGNVGMGELCVVVLEGMVFRKGKHIQIYKFKWL